MTASFAQDSPKKRTAPFIKEPGPLLSPKTQKALRQALAHPDKIRPRFPSCGSIEGPRVKLLALDIERDGAELYRNGHQPAKHVQPSTQSAALSGAEYVGDGNEATVWRYLLWGPFKTEQRFKDQYKMEIANRLCLTVVDKHGLSDGGSGKERKVGIATYCRNAPDALRIELGGIWYAPDAQKSLINTETIYLMLYNIFENCGYQRVDWTCNANNYRSRRAAVKLGFRFDGEMRKHLIIKGRHWDTALYSMSIEDWNEKVKGALEEKVFTTNHRSDAAAAQKPFPSKL